MKVPVPEKKDSIFSPFALMCPQQEQDACLIGKGGFFLLSLLTQTLTLSKTIPKPCRMQCVSSCVGALEPFELTHVANHHNCLATVPPQFSKLPVPVSPILCSQIHPFSKDLASSMEGAWLVETRVTALLWSSRGLIQLVM